MKTLFLILIMGAYLPLAAQMLTLSEVGTLPSVVRETSGIEVNGRNSLWSHNDSGNPPQLYEFDSTGNLIRTIQITNASNTDWEDLAQDDAGNFYIGDFGNNANQRQNLKIYKIPNPDSFTADSIQAEVIAFSYPDQQAFPPPSSGLYFDMEAMIWYNDSLYLFSKNRTNPFDGFTKMYSLPDKPGAYIAEKLDSFMTGTGSSLNFWITAADISPDYKKLVLLSHDKLWQFSCFDGADFFGGAVQQVSLNSFSQKEAICFISNDEVYITDEQIIQGIGGKLYYGDLSLFDPVPKVNLGKDTVVNTSSYILDAGNPGSAYFWNTGDTAQQINIDSSGIYWVKVTGQNGCSETDSVEITLLMPNAVASQTVNMNVKVAPNPFDQFTHIQIEALAENGMAGIYTMQGRKIFEKLLTKGSNDFLFEPALANVYLLKIITGNQMWNYRIIKQY